MQTPPPGGWRSAPEGAYILFKITVLQAETSKMSLTVKLNFTVTYFNFAYGECQVFFYLFLRNFLWIVFPEDLKIFAKR